MIALWRRKAGGFDSIPELLLVCEGEVTAARELKKETEKYSKHEMWIEAEISETDAFHYLLRVRRYGKVAEIHNFYATEVKFVPD